MEAMKLVQKLEQLQTIVDCLCLNLLNLFQNAQ